MGRWLAALFAMLAVAATLLAPSAGAVEAPIGHLGDTLRVQLGDIVADVTVISVLPSDVPPGFGYPPRPPREQLYRGQIAVTAVRVPTPYILATKFAFMGVTITGDAYVPRSSDAPDALQYALQKAPQGATVAGGVWWDCYRDLVSNVVLIEPKSGVHLAQWNV